jgi:sucrose-6-phosphatase
MRKLNCEVKLNTCNPSLLENTVTKLSLFVTDLDHTLVGDDLAMAELNRWLETSREQHGVKVVYSTGRSMTLYKELLEERNLLKPDALVTAVGTEIYYTDYATPDPRWSEKLSPQWDRELIVSLGANFADLELQPKSEQRPFKVSYKDVSEEIAKKILPELETLLQDQGLDTQLIYSGGKDLDILPIHAGKGLAMLFLQQKWRVEPTRTVVCGDSGNDCALFSVGEERGIIVGNARPELLDWHEANPAPNHFVAKAHYARGIIEGLEHFGF